MHKGNKILFISFLLFIFSQITFANTIVKKFFVAQNQNQDQFIFELSKDTKITVFSLPSPSRIVIDLDDTRINKKLDKSLLHHTFVKDIREALDDNGVLRIVLDLQKNVKYKSVHSKLPNGGLKLTISVPARVSEKKTNFQLSKNISSPSNNDNFFPQEGIENINGSIIVVQNNKVTKKNVLKSYSFIDSFEQLAKKIVKPRISKVVSTVPKPDIPDNLQQKSRDIIIVIDPGHGGKDPGVISAHGVREKDVVLAVAKDLRWQLNQEFGVKAILTRGGDYFLPLKERLRVARENNADLFISIHADAYKKSASIRGVSIFALSASGATSESARWLAEKENESEINKSVDKNILRSVVMGFVQKTTIQSSLDIAKSVLLQLPSIAKLHTHRIEQASFVVLKAPNIPSLLLETGFLSDPEEEASLQDFNYDNKLALAIKNGITHYFIENPPAGTYLSDLKNTE